jgi:squalene-hopene/tetraprenyl-beta-curcumene cyclase
MARSLSVLERMQPISGGFLEATPLTSFVVMSLASSGQARHPVVQRGLAFLLDSVRDDGSWPIDTNLATWVTTLSLNALGGAAGPASPDPAGSESAFSVACLDWLLSCQHRDVHPYTGSRPGGWGWSDLSGAVPDGDDTPGALLALAAWLEADPDRKFDSRQRVLRAGQDGITWLLALQNRDGGWPTFCRGWGKLPFDRSATDITAHALRALHAWNQLRVSASEGRQLVLPERLRHRIAASIARGFNYLDRYQKDDGCWTPLWFGNQYEPNDENPVYGTAKALFAYRDAGRMDNLLARRAVRWLIAHQRADGGWGGMGPDATKVEFGAGVDPGARGSSVEETALAVEALLAATDNTAVQEPLSNGLRWLVDAVEGGRHQRSSPIGFYFAKLWY